MYLDVVVLGGRVSRGRARICASCALHRSAAARLEYCKGFVFLNMYRRSPRFSTDHSRGFREALVAHMYGGHTLGRWSARPTTYCRAIPSCSDSGRASLVASTHAMQLGLRDQKVFVLHNRCSAWTPHAHEARVSSRIIKRGSSHASIFMSMLCAASCAAAVQYFV